MAASSKFREITHFTQDHTVMGLAESKENPEPKPRVLSSVTQL